MKVVILDRPRHNKLIKTVAELGAELILVKDDDLTPTIAVAKNEVDLIIGVGGVPEAVLSAIIIEKLGGEMCLRIIPTHIAQDEGLLGNLNNWDLFKKNEIDVLRNFKIVRPGTEKYLESAWNTIWNSKELASGNDMVFTASVIKKTPWITFPDGKEVPGVALDTETGEVVVQVIRIAHNDVEITPVIYKTAISKFLPRRDAVETSGEAGNRCFELGKAYSEFGAFQKAKECLQKAGECNPDKNLLQKCHFTKEYVEGLDALVNKPIQISELLIEHFENACRLDANGEECHRAVAMIKRFYEYLGDRNYQYRRYAEAIAHYQMALKYVPHDLRLHRKVNSIQMKEIIEEYFNRIDAKYQEYHYTEPPDWKKQKLDLALEIFYGNEKRLNLSCKEPWLVFFRRTALHGERPSYKLAILTKLLQLFKKLNHADGEELSSFLSKEFRIRPNEIESILRYKLTHHSFRSVGKLYLIKELSLDCLLKLLHPPVKVESQNELEDANIPLSISLVEAMEQRYKNILEELKEGSK
ncbi:MAG: fructose-bisphosphatase class II, partial [Planctomycetota bacterium]